MIRHRRTPAAPLSGIAVSLRQTAGNALAIAFRKNNSPDKPGIWTICCIQAPKRAFGTTWPAWHRFYRPGCAWPRSFLTERPYPTRLRSTPEVYPLSTLLEMSMHGPASLAPQPDGPGQTAENEQPCRSWCRQSWAGITAEPFIGKRGTAFN
jgi:hypothetical protein